MSLNTWEQRTLGHIAWELADAAPELTSMLTVFNRLTSGEAMPDRQPVSKTRQAALHRSRTRPQRSGARCQRRRGLRVWPLAAVALTVITAIVMTLVLTLTSHGSGQSTACAQTWSIVCPRH
ncbi:MAG TPA: hypothetical protein VIZ43_06400 [Trebonia sp.]